MAIKKRRLLNLGIPKGEALRVAQQAVHGAHQLGLGDDAIEDCLREVLERPQAALKDPVFDELARVLSQPRRPFPGRKDDIEPTGSVRSGGEPYRVRRENAPYRIWGTGLEEGALQQMANASRLPIAVRGALMPDAHQGYGLPIGGVLATRDAVIPYAVGVDIACRMKLTVLDIPVSALESRKDFLIGALNAEKRFGVGAGFKQRRRHKVMDEDWDFSSVVRQLKDKAWLQLGTSGSGNHFVEYGSLTVTDSSVGLEKGDYLAILSHSGSRGAGNMIATHFSKVALQAHPEIPRELSHLSWLDTTSHAGREYWSAMELMGRYAAANHALIHFHIAKALGADVLLDIENHHNFAWEEEHDGERVIVHRKGATPAQTGVFGIIPGNMADPAYIVRGRGVEASLNSASHGAGRRMSRKKAKQTINRKELEAYLTARKVKLLSAGLDEAPMAYKDINEVMAAQSDLVDVMGRFQPRIVKMAPGGERPED